MPYRHATPYHAPLYLAQSKGYFKDEGIKVALLEPNDPSVLLPLAYTHRSTDQNPGCHRDYRLGQSRSRLQGHDPHARCLRSRLPRNFHRLSPQRAFHRRRVPDFVGHHARLHDPQRQKDRLRRRVRQDPTRRVDRPLRHAALGLHGRPRRHERNQEHHQRRHRRRHRSGKRADGRARGVARLAEPQPRRSAHAAHRRARPAGLLLLLQHLVHWQRRLHPREPGQDPRVPARMQARYRFRLVFARPGVEGIRRVQERNGYADEPQDLRAQLRVLQS